MRPDRGASAPREERRRDPPAGRYPIRGASAPGESIRRPAIGPKAGPERTLRQGVSAPRRGRLDEPRHAAEPGKSASTRLVNLQAGNRWARRPRLRRAVATRRSGVVKTTAPKRQRQPANGTPEVSRHRRQTRSPRAAVDEPCRSTRTHIRGASAPTTRVSTREACTGPDGLDIVPCPTRGAPAPRRG